MSDPTWASRVLVSGAEAVIYVQLEPTAGGDPTAPADANMMSFVTELSITAESQTSEKGPWLQLNKVKKSRAGLNFSGSFSSDMAKGADAVYALWLQVTHNDSQRLRITIEVTDGPSWVAKQCIPSYEFSGDASDGYATSFSFESDDIVPTAAS